MTDTILQKLARLEITEQDLREELNSLYNSQSLGPLIETRAERLSGDLQDIQNQIVKLKAQQKRKEPIVVKSFADLANYKIGG